MFTEKFEIIALDQNQALLKPLRQKTCGGCQLNASCGVGLFANYFNQPIKQMVDDDAQQGDVITLRLAEKQVLKHAFLLYIVPLLVMLTTAFMSQWLFGKQDNIAVLSGIFGLGFSMLMLRYYYRR